MTTSVPCSQSCCLMSGLPSNHCWAQYALPNPNTSLSSLPVGSKYYLRVYSLMGTMTTSVPCSQSCCLTSGLPSNHCRAQYALPNPNTSLSSLPVGSKYYLRVYSLMGTMTTSVPCSQSCCLTSGLPSNHCWAQYALPNPNTSLSSLPVGSKYYLRVYSLMGTMTTSVPCSQSCCLTSGLPSNHCRAQYALPNPNTSLSSLPVGSKYYLRVYSLMGTMTTSVPCSQSCCLTSGLPSNHCWAQYALPNPNTSLSSLPVGSKYYLRVYSLMGTMTTSVPCSQSCCLTSGLPSNHCWAQYALPNPNTSLSSLPVGSKYYLRVYSLMGTMTTSVPCSQSCCLTSGLPSNHCRAQYALPNPNTSLSSLPVGSKYYLRVYSLMGTMTTSVPCSQSCCLTSGLPSNHCWAQYALPNPNTSLSSLPVGSKYYLRVYSLMGTMTTSVPCSQSCCLTSGLPSNHCWAQYALSNSRMATARDLQGSQYPR